jgi:hypothetical protein
MPGIYRRNVRRVGQDQVEGPARGEDLDRLPHVAEPEIDPVDHTVPERIASGYRERPLRNVRGQYRSFGKPTGEGDGDAPAARAQLQHAWPGRQRVAHQILEHEADEHLRVHLGDERLLRDLEVQPKKRRPPEKVGHRHVGRSET